jgi:Flp pilus assembly protein TadG
MHTCTRPPIGLCSLRGRLRDQRGQAVVEFAIVLPILMLIILGILYFGRYESYSTQMTQLAEQGARDAAVDYQVTSGSYNGTSCSTNNSIACFIASQASGELAAGSSDAAQISVNVDCAGGSSCTAGQNVTVCTQSKVQFPFLPIKAGTIYQSATMRVEQVGSGGTGSAAVTDSSVGSNVPHC